MARQHQRPTESKVKVHQPLALERSSRPFMWTSVPLLMTVVVLLLSPTVTPVHGQRLPEGSALQHTSGSGAGPLHHRRHQQHHHHRESAPVVDLDDKVAADDDGGGGANPHNGKPLGNFLLTDYLNDGERERRISWNGIIGKETSLADTGSNKTLALWQMATGTYLMQIIYNSDGDMMDCEYVRQRSLVHQFHERFRTEFKQARARNFSSPFTLPARGRQSLVSDHEFREYLEHDVVTSEMEELQYNVYEFPAGVPQAQRAADAFGMRNLTYIPLRTPADIPDELRGQLNFHELKQRCNVRHMQLKEIASGLRSADPEHQRIANEKLQRQRRDLSSMLRVPGTKWCGKGWSARNYVEMGGYSKADRCCRQHDLSCPFWMLGFETKYGLFNWRVNTLMHCSCDERFRTCLKMADSSDANLVGKLFFNIVQMKCFVLKPESVCVKKSWWGKCEKKIRRKRAHLRDNRKF
ncbi:uncharacterized protein LOC128277490 isoform X2 [Anopheles cruzii]|uniref:uncharacterized protein LOC128277490 isoform X2 n=1 Tax=Anopheles cruzii TaxID=68878 RepID=UPI0022EC2EC5|nr:uncharacterized protein LOC128277490 isoform X2 [Anopheles cruzii]